MGHDLQCLYNVIQTLVGLLNAGLDALEGLAVLCSVA
jgi:hypothetical protein